MIKILVVEDEKSISNLIKVNLIDAGYYCNVAYDGLTAADFIEQNQYDLILLDIMLPKLDGYELIEYIKTRNIPVIFLTARTSINDKVKGLKIGAEDYITKPFDIEELLARIEVVLRRYNKNSVNVVIDDININIESRKVTKNGKTVELTNKEFELLLMFVRNKNIALYRDIIFEKVWESDYLGDTRTVDLHVQRLRKKLKLGNRIKSVYKIGYILEV